MWGLLTPVDIASCTLKNPRCMRTRTHTHPQARVVNPHKSTNPNKKFANAENLSPQRDLSATHTPHRGGNPAPQTRPDWTIRRLPKKGRNPKQIKCFRLHPFILFMVENASTIWHIVLASSDQISGYSAGFFGSRAIDRSQVRRHPPSSGLTQSAGEHTSRLRQPADDLAPSAKPPQPIRLACRKTGGCSRVSRRAPDPSVVDANP